MSAVLKRSIQARFCPFCGMASDVNHESQEACIAALQKEVNRMRSVLAHLKPAGPGASRDEHEPAQAIRLLVD